MNFCNLNLVIRMLPRIGMVCSPYSRQVKESNLFYLLWGGFFYAEQEENIRKQQEISKEESKQEHWQEQLNETLIQRD